MATHCCKEVHSVVKLHAIKEPDSAITVPNTEVLRSYNKAYGNPCKVQLIIEFMQPHACDVYLGYVLDKNGYCCLNVLVYFGETSQMAVAKNN